MSIEIHSELKMNYNSCYLGEEYFNPFKIIKVQFMKSKVVCIDLTFHINLCRAVEELLNLINEIAIC